MKTLQNKVLAMAVIVGLMAVVAVFALFVGNQRQAEGSVMIGGEYQSTTTTALINASTTVVYSGTGVFGSVVITNPELTTGTFTFYDGTTTSSHPDWATTTLANFSVGSTAGTYTFDVSVRKGLIFEYKGSGLLASSTVTFKQYSGF